MIPEHSGNSEKSGKSDEGSVRLSPSSTSGIRSARCKAVDLKRPTTSGLRHEYYEALYMYKYLVTGFGRQRISRFNPPSARIQVTER